jgi:prophage regulatory protein
MANLLRVQQVASKTGYSVTTIWRRVKTGDFPTPVSIGPNATAWIEQEVDAWVQARIDASRNRPEAA